MTTTSPGPILRLTPFWMPLPSVLGPFKTVDYFIVSRNFLGIIESAACHKRSAAVDDVINLRDLAVLDAAGGFFCRRS